MKKLKALCLLSSIALTPSLLWSSEVVKTSDPLGKTYSFQTLPDQKEPGEEVKFAPRSNYQSHGLSVIMYSSDARSLATDKGFVEANMQAGTARAALQNDAQSRFSTSLTTVLRATVAEIKTLQTQQQQAAEQLAKQQRSQREVVMQRLHLLGQLMSSDFAKGKVADGVLAEVRSDCDEMTAQSTTFATVVKQESDAQNTWFGSLKDMSTKK